jgi:tetratricopeptide (TPR) repeat protein
MAFGFGFNKQKVLSAAEKFVQQGKLQNAITEYEKVRKNDDKDLTVANTIGDLYARLGDTAKAIECFKTVGDAYAAQGFTVKGIAMYKKITKLQPSVDGSLKLAELYTQQGLFNDARAQYLQVAEDFMKNGDLDQAVRLFQKVLEMDPENVPMRLKLAEVYLRLGKKKEAWEIFSAAAESLRARGSAAAAEDVLKRMLVLDPGNSYVLLLRGKAAVEGGDPKRAIEYLEKVSDIDSHPEGLRDLLKAYLENGELPKCAPLAEKLLTVHNDPEGLFILADGATRLGSYDQALEIYTKHADRLLTTDSAKLLGNLHSLITHVQGDAGALEKLMDLLGKSGESTHVNEVAELLAHASVKNGNLDRARELYKMLADSEPQNTMHMQNYQQVERMASPAVHPGITAEEGALIVEELEATAPVIDQSYPDQIAIEVRSAVTDADLFLSYNLPDKAIVPLLGVLPQAPRDVRLNQRLAALHTRFERFREAAVCCRTLESAYHDAGYPDEAMRYGELAARYEETLPAGTVPMEPAPAPSWPTATVPKPEKVAPQELAIPEMDVQAPAHGHDFSSDLSSEWEQSLSVEESAAVDEHPAAETRAIEAQSADTKNMEASPEIDETVEEIRFYLEHFMTDQARSAFEKLEALTQDAAILDPLRCALEAGGKAAEEPEVEIADAEVPEADASEIEINADDPETFNIGLETPAEPAAEEFATSPDLMSGFEHAHHEAAVEPEAEDLEPVQDADATHFGLKHEEPIPAEPVHAAATQENSDELSALVADLEASIGDSLPAAAPEEPATVEPEPGVAQHEAVEPEVTEPVSKTLPSWPTVAPSKWTPAPPPQLEPEPELEPVAQAAATPVAPEVLPVVTAGAGGAAAAPAMSLATSPEHPSGTDAVTGHADSVDLAEMFGELKHELEEEIAAGDDDPETHYNMGVAFREMGLLDEAIAELQKVCNWIDRGHPFAQAIQTYTWLAQCFLDKGVPEAAIRWYEKALNIPGIDGEARVAINYELGSACESAQDKPGALRHFTYVYGANIDYRDVAERIQALKS